LEQQQVAQQQQKLAYREKVRFKTERTALACSRRQFKPNQKAKMNMQQRRNELLKYAPLLSS
jgi:hypothetical protein